MAWDSPIANEIMRDFKHTADLTNSTVLAADVVMAPFKGKICGDHE